MLTPEQIRIRSTGLGGTDMVAICGQSKYRNPIDIYLEKRNGLGLPIEIAPPKPFTGNERTEWGHILEPILADRYSADTGLRLVEPDTFRHPTHEWMMGTPDRLCFDDELRTGTNHVVLNAYTGDEIRIDNLETLWEGKSHGFMGAKDYDLHEMEVPDDKKIQTAWYMALTGCKRCDLSALIDTHLYRVFRLGHDQQVEDYLLEEAELFWRKVQKGIEPPPDGTKGFKEYLAERFKLQTEDMVDMPAEVFKEIAEYRKARSDRKTADGRMELAKQRIQLAIGSRRGLLGPTGKPIATWKRNAGGSTSYKDLAIHLRDLHGMTDAEFEGAKDEFTSDPPRIFRVSKE